MQPSWLVVAALLFAAPANADEDEFSAEYATCMQDSGGVTMPMIQCIHAELQVQDAALNAAYKALRAELTPARKTQLQTVQRAWIAYRDANCLFYDDPDGGTLARVAANDCMLRETAARAAELRSLLQEG